MTGIMQEWWAQRAPREQTMLLAGGIIILLFFVVEWMILPTVDRIQQLNRLVSEKERNLGTFAELRKNYEHIHLRLDQIKSKIDKQDAAFSLVAYIEQMTISQQVNHTIVVLRPNNAEPFEGYQETAVELSLKKITLGQIISFLQALESSPYFIHVKQFSMKSRFSDSSFLDVHFIVSSYAPTSLPKTLPG